MKKNYKVTFKVNATKENEVGYRELTKSIVFVNVKSKLDAINWLLDGFNFQCECAFRGEGYNSFQLAKIESVELYEEK